MSAHESEVLSPACPDGSARARVYQVEVYLPEFDQWVAIGPECLRDLDALRVLEHTPAPDSQKRILLVETAEGAQKTDRIVLSGVDTRHVQFTRYLIGTGRLSDGTAALTARPSQAGLLTER